MSDRAAPPRRLPCPECYPKYGGSSRIGNRRASCTTCNRFVQDVRRRALALLKAEHPEEFLDNVYREEVSAYRKVVQKYKESLTSEDKEK